MRDSIEVALLMAIGYILWILTPPLVLGMKPDLVLAMLFTTIVMKKDFKLAIQAGLLAGLITALTTTFPGGQIPNMVDKILTTLVVFGFIKVSDKLDGKIQLIILGILGTIFSGSTFLLVAALTVGLPGSFLLLFTTVVLPTAVVNTIALVVLYPIVQYSRKRVVGRLETTTH